MLLFLSNLLVSHAHNSLHRFFCILGSVIVVDVLVNKSMVCTVHVGSAYMAKYIQVFALFCELKHPQCSKIVYVQGSFEHIVKSDGGSTVDNNIYVFSHHFPVLSWHCQTLFGQVTIDKNDFALNVLFELGTTLELTFVSVEAI